MKKPAHSSRVLLHPVQKSFHDSQAIFRGFVGGRGSGKSRIGAYDLLLRAARRPGLYLLGAPTYRMLGDQSGRTFLALGQTLGLLQNFAKGAMTAFLTNGSEVLFRSADDPEKFRGPNLSGMWLDEASLMAHESYSIGIACLRERGQMGWLSCTFTPKGKQHWTYNVFGPDPLTGVARPRCELFHCKTRDNPFLPPDFETIIRGEYAPTLAAQELGGEFLDPQGSLFRKEWLRYYTRQGDYYRLGDRAVAGASLTKFATVDLACSTHDSGDYTVIAVWHTTRQGDLILCDLLRQKLEAPGILSALRGSWQQHAWRFAAIEANGMQLAVVQMARDQGIPCRPIHSSRDKVNRSLGLQVRAEEGKFWLPTTAHWLPDYESELLTFPDGIHDDQVDASCHADEVLGTLLQRAGAVRPFTTNGMSPL